MNDSHFITQSKHATNYRKVMVIGDFMLDIYMMGVSHRISPEAPVPILHFQEEIVRLGGAGNVVANLHGLGLTAFPVGVVGTDSNGQKIQKLLADIDCETNTIFEINDHITTSKTRIVSQFQQIVRIDSENHVIHEAMILNQLWPEVESAIRSEKISVCIISDYDKGVCHPLLLKKVIDLAKMHGVPVLVDPKKSELSVYQGATYIVPNLKEFSGWFPQSEHNEEKLIHFAQNIRKDYKIENMIITRGSNGMLLISGEADPVSIPSKARDVFDVSGAGDTVIAMLAAGIIWGLRTEEAARLSNIAAGIVIGKFGTSPIHICELKNALYQNSHQEKIVTIEELKNLLLFWRSLGKKIVFTNGCFDLLHVGHLHFLSQAKSLGDILIVGLNTDQSVKNLKSSERPIILEQERAQFLSALEDVDIVILFEEDTPISLIEAIQPDILVKGSDYSDKEIAGRDLVESSGGKVVLLPVVEGYSTTALLRKIKKLNNLSLG